MKKTRAFCSALQPHPGLLAASPSPLPVTLTLSIFSDVYGTVYVVWYMHTYMHSTVQSSWVESQVNRPKLKESGDTGGEADAEEYSVRISQ